jgi:hypothetical protein
MLRLILAAVVLLVLFAGGLAVVLFHFLGWKGLVAFPFVAIAFVWLGKIIVGKLLSVAAGKLVSIKSEVLRGATMTVRAVIPVAEPDIEIEDLDEEKDGPVESNGHQEDNEDFESGEGGRDNEEAEEDEDEEGDEPREYFEVDLTITPQKTTAERFWEPGELLLTSGPASRLEDLANTEVGSAYDVEVFDGSDFDTDEDGKYAGEQRLKVVFAVKPGMSKAWLQYYNETLGSLDLPPWKA